LAGGAAGGLAHALIISANANAPAASPGAGRALFASNHILLVLPVPWATLVDVRLGRNRQHLSVPVEP
jgi:hypothetical protein